MVDSGTSFCIACRVFLMARRFSVRAKLRVLTKVLAHRVSAPQRAALLIAFESPRAFKILCVNRTFVRSRSTNESWVEEQE